MFCSFEATHTNQSSSQVSHTDAEVLLSKRSLHQSITDYMFGDFWEFLLAKMFIYLPMFDICVGHSSTSNVLQKKSNI